jgi:hypothetical protein
MRKVFKYPLPLDEIGWFRLRLPAGALILAFQAQRGTPTIWALVDPDAELQTRTFFLSATGQQLPEERSSSLLYVGTIQQGGGVFIWHLFELFGE